MFNHVEVNLPKLIRENVDGVRMYRTPDGKNYPSVTTVLSDYNKSGIMEWRKRVGEKKANEVSRKATTRGTGVHTAIEQYLYNKTPEDMMPDVRQLFARMKGPLNKINNIHCLETGLYSHELRLAGTVDCIAEFDGELSVIDFKTANRLKKKADISNYFMQCTAYAKMYEEMTGHKIGNVTVLIGVESAEFPQVMHASPDDYIDELNDYIAKYYQRIN